MDDKKNRSQEYRDQADHDQLTRIGVLVETVLTKIAGLENQIKDATITQSAALSTLDAKTTSNHNGLDLRVRKLEETSNKYLPDYINRFDLVVKDVDDLKMNKTQVLSGWKTFLFIFGSLSGITSIIWTLINIFK